MSQCFGIGQCPFPHVVTALAHGGQKHGQRTLYIKEVIRVAADVGFAAGLAPVGQHHFFVGIGGTVQFCPGQCAGNAPFDLFIKRLLAADCLLGIPGSYDHGLEAAVTLAADDSEGQVGNVTPGRFTIFFRAQAMVVERHQYRHAKLCGLGVSLGAIIEVQYACAV